MSMLRSIRERKGFSVAQLAGRAGISAKVLTEYEEGRLPISLPHAKLLAKALWVGIEELIPPPGTVVPPSVTPNIAQPTQPTQPAQPASNIAQDAASKAEASGLSPQHGVEAVEAAGGEQALTHPPREGRPVSSAPAVGTSRTERPMKSSPVSSTITEGQLQELLHLALRLQVDRARLEEQIGRPLDALRRVEAKEWIKKLRAMADEVAPNTRVKYGQWPEAKEDVEATYLREQKEAQAPFMFKLFNGESFMGTIADFTPYTITVKQDGSDVVIRKLAIAYYRQVTQEETMEKPSDEITDKSMKTRQRAVQGGKEHEPHDPLEPHEPDNRRTPERRTNSDRVGAPAKPEEDNMDRDRGT